MSITPFANKAELNVRIGQTSVEQLRAFGQQAGDGELRARKNDDGSFTLYVAADRKPRISALFSSYKADARQEKQTLARTLIGEIISRRMPAGSGAAGELVASLTKGRPAQKPLSVGDMAGKLKQVDTITYEAIPKELSARFNHNFGTRDALKFPELVPLLMEAGRKGFTAENLQFLIAVQDFARCGTVNAAMDAAERIFADFRLDPDGGSGDGDTFSRHGAPDLNLGNSTLETLREGMQRLRGLHAAGSLTAPQDTLLLSRLFDKAADEIDDIFTQNTLMPFKSADNPAWVSFVGARLNASAAARDNPLAQALPGSGAEILARLKRDHGAFLTLDRTLADPAARQAFAEDLRGKPGEGLLRTLDTVAGLQARMHEPSGGKEWTNAALEGAVRSLVAEVAGLDVFADRLAEISRQSARESGAGTATSPGDQPGEGPNARERLRDLLSDIAAHARGRLEVEVFPAFSKARIQPALAEIGRQLAIEQADASLSVDQFTGREATSSGGATGSGTKRIGGQGYQEKTGFETKSLLTRLKMGFSNAENYGELVASSLARAMTPGGAPGLSPEVQLRHNPVTHDTFITSKWLAGGQGDLKAFYKAQAGLLPGDNSRIVVRLGSTEPSGAGRLNLSGQLADDMMRQLAVRAILGDHDCNTGNFVVVRDDAGEMRVAGIDYGHALNDLVAGRLGPLLGGGEKFPGNRILDFFNRETVNHVQPSKQVSKLWRDFEGIEPSPALAAALRDTAEAARASTPALDRARDEFAAVLSVLEADDSSEARARLGDLDRSFRAIGAKIGADVNGATPREVVGAVFQAIATFIADGARQMDDVARLCDLQAMANDHAGTTQPGTELPAELVEAFEALCKAPGIGQGENGLVWLKQSRGAPAFKGGLAAYVETQRAARRQG